MRDYETMTEASNILMKEFGMQELAEHRKIFLNFIDVKADSILLITVIESCS
jgi:hypothetical protein